MLLRDLSGEFRRGAKGIQNPLDALLTADAEIREQSLHQVQCSLAAALEAEDGLVMH